MKPIQNPFVSAGIIGLAAVLPFVVMEWITTRGFARSGFPAAVYSALWLLGGGFVIAYRSTLRRVRAGPVRSRPLPVLSSAACALVLGWAWLGLVADQLLCFLGASGC